MTPKEKSEELQKCADRHRAIHDWRQKLESRVLFTSLSFYAGATFAVLKLETSPSESVKYALSISYLLLAFITSILLKRIHLANQVNVAISENYEAEIIKVLEIDPNPIPKDFQKPDYNLIHPVKFFKSNWGWQTCVTSGFAFAGILLLWLS